MRRRKKSSRAPALIVLALAVMTAGAALARPVLPPVSLPAFAQPVGFMDTLRGFLFGSAQESAASTDLYALNDDKTFADNTRTIHFSPYSNPALEFDMHLPKTWTAEDLTKGKVLNFDQSLIGDIVAVQSEMIGVHRLRGTISIQPVKRETSAMSWLKGYVFNNGFALQGEVKENGPRSAYAYYSWIDGQINYFTYMTVQITGDIVFIGRMDVPLQLKEFTGYVQRKFLDSLQISYPKEDPIEPQKTFSLVDAVKFSYPVSWQPMSPDYKDMTRLSVQLHSKGINGEIDGFMRFLAVRRGADTDVTKEIEQMKKHFSDYMKLDITKLVSSSKIEGLNKRFIFSRLETYQARYQKEGPADPEVRLALLGDTDWYIFVYLITPREQEDLPTWAHNTRSMDMSLKSMR